MGINSLTLSYEPEDEWHGKLTARVASEGFAGRSSAWFGVERLRAFIDALGAFPISPGNEPTLEGGFWKDAAVSQSHLSLRIEPIGSRGALLLTTSLATPIWNTEKADLHHRVSSRFLVNYADLARFQSEFCTLLDGNAPEATLKASCT